MALVERLSRAFRGKTQATQRLGDFTLAGRLGPIAALAAVSAAMYVHAGYNDTLQLLLELCAAYAVAFLALAGLSALAGPDPPWRYILPTALAGTAAGGVASVMVGYAPNWLALLDYSRLLPEWGIGAAFAGFFVGVSLAGAAVRERDRAEFETRERLLEARLQMLAARIEPHFLMNTLANVRYLVKSDPALAYAMLDHLSDFLQAALELSRDLSSTLGQELQIVQSYLTIMRIRMGDKLEFDFDLDEPAAQVPFPSLLLQTLVENAIQHGIEPLENAGSITIRTHDGSDCVGVEVSDTGAGFENVAEPGLGLQNVRDRLETFYRGRASFDIASAPGRGTKVTLTIPKNVA